VTSQDQAAILISELIGAGEPVTESVPAAFAAVTWAGCDPQRAILLAANCRGDTDTVAAMAGALSGANSGATAIPPQWSQLVADVNQLDVDAWVATLAGEADGVTGVPRERPHSPPGASHQGQR
jgi:ADP-ribosylglycohydrolase